MRSCQLRDRQVQPDQLVPLANQVYLDAVATTVTTDFLVALEPLDHQAREVTKVVVVLMANRAPLDKDDVVDLANVDIQAPKALPVKARLDRQEPQEQTDIQAPKVSPESPVRAVRKASATLDSVTRLPNGPRVI